MLLLGFDSIVLVFLELAWLLLRPWECTDPNGVFCAHARAWWVVGGRWFAEGHGFSGAPAFSPKGSRADGMESVEVLAKAAVFERLPNQLLLRLAPQHAMYLSVDVVSDISTHSAMLRRMKLAPRHAIRRSIFRYTQAISRCKVYLKLAPKHAIFRSIDRSRYIRLLGIYFRCAVPVTSSYTKNSAKAGNETEA